MCDLWVSFLCFLVRNVVCTPVRTADSRVQAHVYARCVYVNPDVEFIFKKCLKLCSMKFSTYLGSILQQKQNCLQGSDTNLEFNT